MRNLSGTELTTLSQFQLGSHDPEAPWLQFSMAPSATTLVNRKTMWEGFIGRLLDNHISRVRNKLAAFIKIALRQMEFVTLH